MPTYLPAVGVFEAVVIFDELLYKPGGQVHRWMTLLCHHFEAHAKHYAPERSGELRAGIVSTARPFGLKQMQGTIASLANHSLFVLRGTGYPVKGHAGSIYARRVWAKGEGSAGAYATIWAYVDPFDPQEKASRKAFKGSVRRQVEVRLKGHFMAFGPDEYGPKVIAPEVSGQEPNNFLFDAWRATARTHSSLRGLAPSASIVNLPGA